MMVTLIAFEFQNKMNNIIRIRDLNEKEIAECCAVREKNNVDISFNEALIRFLEFYGDHVSQALNDLFGESHTSVAINLNIFLKNELKKVEPDARIVNLVYKYGSQRLGLGFKKDCVVYSDLYILSDNYLKVRLSI